MQKKLFCWLWTFLLLLFFLSFSCVFRCILFMLDSFATFFRIIVPIVESKLFNLLLTLYYTVVALRWGHNQQEKVLHYFFVNFNLQYFNMNFPIKILAFAEKKCRRTLFVFHSILCFFFYRHNFFCSSMLLNFWWWFGISF